MKVELSTFKLYVAELRTIGVIHAKDENRILRSLVHKGYGFIHDLATLANDIRLGISTGTFSLSEHTNKVFRKSHGSALPQFLGGSLSEIFLSCGQLRPDFCAYTVSHLLTFLDALKRTDPPKKHSARLEQELWSGLRSRFSELPQVGEHIASQFRSDLSFRSFLQRVKFHFNSVLSRADVDDVVFATGPGANLDKFASVTSSDWSVPYLELNMFSHVPTFQAVIDLFNRVPFQDIPDPWRDTRYPLQEPCATMKCSAQRKSYKTYRGVGVMHALRMSAQLSLQRVFYRDCLTPQMPLTDQGEMTRNLVTNFQSVGTIDLSAASDRLYWPVLHYLGSGSRWFDEAFELRTQDLKLPDGYLHCASPVMGEAITFPLLSLFCYSVAMAVCDRHNSGHSLVRIYGDDVQTCHYDETIRRFEQLGVQVNKTKSYPPTSPFKESCESHLVSAPDGELVRCRPTYLPSITTEEYLRPIHVLQLLTISKSAHREGNYCLADAAADLVERKSTIKRVPHVRSSGDELGRPHDRPPLDFCSITFSSKIDQSFEISEDGFARHCMRTIGADIPIDPKIQAKTTFQRKLRTVRSVKVKNALKEFELQVVLSIGEVLAPDAMYAMREQGRSDLDIKSWILSNCDEDQICVLIQRYQDILASRLTD